MAYHPFRHLGLKIMAIALATALWLTVAGEHVVERSMRVPLAVRNLPNTLEIVGDLPAAVDVRVRGSSAQLSRIDPGEVVAMLDLTNARTGSRLFHLRTDEVDVPYGIEVAQVMPPTLSLTVEKSVRRTVPIVPATDGDPAPGFVVGRMLAEPSTVEIVGPESRVREVTSATTEPLEIDGKNDRVRDVVTVGVADSSVRLTQPMSATVVVGDRAGAGRARGRGGAGALAQPGHGAVVAAHCAGGGGGDDPGPAGETRGGQARRHRRLRRSHGAWTGPV